MTNVESLEAARKAALIALGLGNVGSQSPQRTSSADGVIENSGRPENESENKGDSNGSKDLQSADNGPDDIEMHSDLLEVMKRFSQRGIPVAADGEQNDTDAKSGAALSDLKNTDAEDAQSEYSDDEVDADMRGTNSNSKRPQQDDAAKKSRRQKKLEARNMIARLKAIAASPEVIDAWDVSARDPVLLVHLKSWPNSVAVPGNWRQKRKYLQSKRGIEKRAFQLPSFISDTGVGALRDAQLEADDKKTLKQKQREKMRAKLGRGVEVDETALHDAFFKFQTKPRLTGHGDLYYELRELEVDHSRFKPGQLSGTLRAALGVAADDPPPWLIYMQRYGPPPGYPGLKVPGLNAPIPPGRSFGYHPGGWGKPPVDESGRPIYGDVFGEGRQYEMRDSRFDLSDAQLRTLWGEMRKEDEIVFSVQPEDIDPSEINGKIETEARGDETKSLATPKRERRRDTSHEEMDVRRGVPEGSLYTVLKEKKMGVGQTDFLGSSHVYDIPGSNSGQVYSDTSGPSATGLAGRNSSITKDASRSESEPAQVQGVPEEAVYNGRKRKDNERNDPQDAKKLKSFKF